jgi:PBP1b-binding outer membrane lipoprotein LpoB
MILKKLRVFRFYLSLILLTLFLSSCGAYKDPISKNTNFDSMLNDMVKKSAMKIKKNVAYDEVVLVSDFVNLDNLKNRSQLGFLLSNLLKDRLSSLDVIRDRTRKRVRIWTIWF